jgi:hypothetical protein
MNSPNHIESSGNHALRSRQNDCHPILKLHVAPTVSTSIFLLPLAHALQCSTFFFRSFSTVHVHPQEHVQQITHLSYFIYFLSPLPIAIFVFLTVSAIADYPIFEQERCVF